jgi:hypothetical protein
VRVSATAAASPASARSRSPATRSVRQQVRQSRVMSGNGGVILPQRAHGAQRQGPEEAFFFVISVTQ